MEIVLCLMLDDGGAPRKLLLVQEVAEPEVLVICSCEVHYTVQVKIPYLLKAADGWWWDACLSPPEGQLPERLGLMVLSLLPAGACSILVRYG